MQDRQNTVRVTSFQPPAHAQPENVNVRRVPIVSPDTNPNDLWQYYYQEARDNCNTHEAAKRFADLMVR